MTKNNKKDLMNALNNFNHAAKALLDVVYDMEGEFNDLNSIEVYPFDKSLDEVVADIDTFVDAVFGEINAEDKPSFVRNVKNHSIVEDKKEFFTAQVTDEETGSIYDMNVIIVNEEPIDETEIVPFKIVNYYHGEPSVEDTQYYIDDWKKASATMMRVQNYLAAYLLTNEGCFASPEEDALYNEPLIRQTLQELRDIIIDRF